MKETAPQDILKKIFCKCTKSCKANCCCRKAGLQCSVTCFNCRGQACTNIDIIIDHCDYDEEIDVTVQHFEQTLTDPDNEIDSNNEEKPEEAEKEQDNLEKKEDAVEDDICQPST